MGKIQNVKASKASNLVLVLRVNLSRTDVFKEEGEGFRGGMAGGKMERGHLLQVFLQPVRSPGQQQLQETDVALQRSTAVIRSALPLIINNESHTHTHTYTVASFESDLNIYRCCRLFTAMRMSC